MGHTRRFQTRVKCRGLSLGRVEKDEGICGKNYRFDFVGEGHQLKLDENLRGNCEDEMSAAGEAVMAGCGAIVVRTGLSRRPRCACFEIEIDKVQHRHEEQQDRCCPPKCGTWLHRFFKLPQNIALSACNPFPLFAARNLQRRN